MANLLKCFFADSSTTARTTSELSVVNDGCFFDKNRDVKTILNSTW